MKTGGIGWWCRQRIKRLKKLVEKEMEKSKPNMELIYGYQYLIDEYENKISVKSTNEK